METKDLNSIGLAYLQMVEKRNTEAKKNHADALHKNQKVLDVHSDEDEDNNDDPTDGDGDIDAADLKKLRQDADKDDKKFDKKKKSSKKDDGDDQDKFKAYTGDDKNDQEGTKVSEAAKYPHMMYDPKTGKGYKAETPADHEKYEKMGYTHDKPEEIDESADLQEGAARQAALAKGLMDYCKEIGKDHMDHKDFADHAKHVKAGNWDQARDHADEQDTEVREKIHSLAIDHLGQGAASELYGGDRKLSKNKGDGKLHASYNESVNVDEATIPDGQTAMTKKPELTKKDKKTMGKIADLMKTANESVNVDDVLALIDQGYTLDQAEAMVAEASCGTVNASRKQPKAGDNDRNMANNQRSIPAKGADTAPVRPGTKQNQRDFDKAARMAKPKDKVSLKPMPAALSKKMKTDEELHGNQHKLDHNKDGKITGPDLKNVRSHGPVQKESVMDRVSNMVEDIRVDIQEDRVPWNDGSGSYYVSYMDRGHAAINRQLKLGPKGKYKNAQKRIDDHNSGKKPDKNIAAMIKDLKKPIPGTNVVKFPGNEAVEVDEVSKETLASYAKKALKDVDTQSRFATEYEKRGMAAKSTAVQDKNFKKANRADDKLRNRKAGINTAIDKMSKESVQEAAKPTGIHHSTPVTAAQANDEQAAGRWTDKAGRNTMTEKEFVDMHTIHPDVLPEFDGNVAAKKTAEAIKKAPKAVAKTPNTPTSKGDQKIMPDPTPYGGPAVKTESYMDKYAKYIRGEI